MKLYKRYIYAEAIHYTCEDQLPEFIDIFGKDTKVDNKGRMFVRINWSLSFSIPKGYWIVKESGNWKLYSDEIFRNVFKEEKCTSVI